MVEILTASKEPASTEAVLRGYLGDGFSQEMLSRYIDPKNTCVIAVENGRVVGLAGCRTNKGKDFLADNAFTLDDASKAH